MGEFHTCDISSPMLESISGDILSDFLTDDDFTAADRWLTAADFWLTGTDASTLRALEVSLSSLKQQLSVI